MLVEVHFTGDSFVAFGPDGKQIKDRAILDQIAFMPFPGFKSFYRVEVSTKGLPAPQALNIQTNIGIKKQ